MRSALRASQLKRPSQDEALSFWREARRSDYQCGKLCRKWKKRLPFLKTTVANGGVIIFAATKIPAKVFTKDLAERAGIAYVSGRWLGGTLTNFPLFQTAGVFSFPGSEKAKGEFEKYTKRSN